MFLYWFFQYMLQPSIKIFHPSSQALGLGRGGPVPGLGPGLAKKDGKCFFFSARVFQAVWAKKGKNQSIFCNFFGIFSKYLAPSGAKYREKGWAVAKIGEGWSTNPFWNFYLLDQTRILVVLACFACFCACFAYVLRMFCVCFAHVLRMFCVCFAHVFGIFLVPREAALAADLITAWKFSFLLARSCTRISHVKSTLSGHLMEELCSTTGGWQWPPLGGAHARHVRLDLWLQQRATMAITSV